MEDNNAFESDNKIKRNRPCKKELFKEEQIEILNKINNILGITKDNNILYLYDIENDEKKKKEILNLSDDIKKYFKAGNWSFYRDEICYNNHVLLCKCIYKEMGYKILSKQRDIIRNNNKIKTTQYIIGKVVISI